MYLQHFELNQFPFSLTPDAEFYCNHAGHELVFKDLLNDLHQGVQLMLVTSAPGLGKTLLSLMLLKAIEDNYFPIYLQHTQEHVQNMCFWLAQKLGLPQTQMPFQQHQLVDWITGQLLQQQKAGKKTTLIIDDAHTLSPVCLETICFLSNLKSEGKKLLQVILFGQTQLRQQLHKKVLKQIKHTSFASYSLSPLTEGELHGYLCHRLSKAGHTYDILFSNKAKKQLFQASEGIPRHVNILSHQALLTAYEKDLKTVDLRSVKRAISTTQSIINEKPILSESKLALPDFRTF